MNFSIKHKYTLVILILILLVIIALSGFSYFQFNGLSSSFINSSSRLMTDALLYETQKRGTVLSGFLAENLINPIYNYDISSIDDLLISFKSYNNVVDVYVYDTEGIILHDGTDEVQLFGSHMDDRGMVRDMLANREPLVKMGKETIEIYHPVALDMQLLGGVKVVLSLAEMNNKIGAMQHQLSAINLSRSKQSYRYLIIASGLVLLFGIILSYTLASRISKPINRMAKFASRVGRGHYDNRLEHKAKDEIGELIDAFNHMQFNLKKSTISIHELENQIDLRTRELAKANEDLARHQEQLEKIVATRTAELLETNEHLTQEIEERKTMQQKLVRSQKMEAIGTLAAGVAHDLNNILTGMVGIPDLMLMDLRDDSPLKDDILTIKKSGQKAAAVVHDLLNLARRNVSGNTIVDVGAIANEYLSSPEHKNILEAHSEIDIITDIQPGRHMILGSRIHLSKALMNLVSNAAESISEHGTITISLHNQIIDPSKGEHRDLKKGKYAVIQVQDSGEGIPYENLEHIFEPFYTTKTMGRSGSGLGLTVVSETVKDHNGHIKVESRVGEGATFTIYLPLTDVEEERTNESTSINSYHGNGESILIVDDVESQRNLLKRILENLGYSAITASSGEDAVEYMKNNSADLLILDMIMHPGIDGLDTYKQIVQFNPGQKAILASGYSEPSRLNKLQTVGIEVCIPKPYTAEQIGKAVRAELDR